MSSQPIQRVPPTYEEAQRNLPRAVFTLPKDDAAESFAKWGTVVIMLLICLPTLCYLCAFAVRIGWYGK